MSSRLLAALILTTAGAVCAGDWSAPVHVLHEMKPCVTYTAKLVGDVLIVHAALQPGWHTFTMDNELRAKEKLAGKPSLGVDQPTQITASGGLTVVGPWYQSAPKDFSKPQLRWFSWGFEQEVAFAAAVRRAGSAGGQVGIRGQACTESTCKNIDVSVVVPPSDANEKAKLFDLSTLIRVR